MDVLLKDNVLHVRRTAVLSHSFSAVSRFVCSATYHHRREVSVSDNITQLNVMASGGDVWQLAGQDEVIVNMSLQRH